MIFSTFLILQSVLFIYYLRKDYREWYCEECLKRWFTIPVLSGAITLKEKRFGFTIH